VQAAIHHDVFILSIVRDLAKFAGTVVCRRSSNRCVDCWVDFNLDGTLFGLEGGVKLFKRLAHVVLERPLRRLELEVVLSAYVY